MLFIWIIIIFQILRVTRANWKCQDTMWKNKLEWQNFKIQLRGLLFQQK